MALERVAIWTSVDVQLLALGGEGGSSGARRAYAGESVRRAEERRERPGGGAEDLRESRQRPPGRKSRGSEGPRAEQVGEVSEGGGARASLGGA